MITADEARKLSEKAEDIEKVANLAVEAISKEIEREAKCGKRTVVCPFNPFFNIQRYKIADRMRTYGYEVEDVSDSQPKLKISW